MPKEYKAYLPDQDLLLPPSLRDWLPENHLVYFVSDVVDQLDLSTIHAHYGDEGRGQPPYSRCVVNVANSETIILAYLKVRIVVHRSHSLGVVQDP
jgi:hypothetical protein